MLYSWLATLVVALHLAFIVFVVAGGFAVHRWPRLAWLHLPCAAWGTFVELTGRVCPLTPLEIWLRHRAGEAGYAAGFIEHYVTAVVYPAGLTLATQRTLGAFVVVANVAGYTLVLRRRRRPVNARA